MNWTDIFAAWGMKDAGSRAACVNTLTAETVYYADPHSGAIEGRPALLAMLDEFRTMMPEGGADVVSSDGFDGHARAVVAFLNGGNTMMTSQYIAQLDTAGRITRLIGFPGLPKT